MAPTRIHADKTPKRIHYIAEWAAKLGKTRAEIIEATGADKSLVSRWFSGTVPKERYLVQLAALFELEEISSLFRDPDDDWIARHFRRLNATEREKVLRVMLDAAGLVGTGTDGLHIQPLDSESFDGVGGGGRLPSRPKRGTAKEKGSE